METKIKCKVYYINKKIYITSDEKIKEGDWCIINYGMGQELVKYHKDYGNQCKKIIATTDTSLRVESKYEDNEGRKHYDNSPLPQPSQGFIEKYIKEYNKGSIITDILVEYNYDAYEKLHCSTYNKQLKVSKDNTITILKNICECCGRKL